MFKRGHECRAAMELACVILAGAAALLLLAFGGVGDDQQPQPRPAHGGALTVRQQQSSSASPSPAPPAPRRRAGARSSGARAAARAASPASRIVGATLLEPEQRRPHLPRPQPVRARLERRCPALDFYRGFYVNADAATARSAPTATRSARAPAASAEIDQFRALGLRAASAAPDIP